MTPWTVAHQAPLSMEFSRQEYWSGLPCPSPGESSWPRDRTWVSCIAGGFFTIWATREAQIQYKYYVNSCWWVANSSFVSLEFSGISFPEYFGSEVGWIQGCRLHRYKGPTTAYTFFLYQWVGNVYGMDMRWHNLDQGLNPQAGTQTPDKTQIET